MCSGTVVIMLTKIAPITHWNMIKQQLESCLKHLGAIDGKNILICLQRDNGWNAKGFDQEAWLKENYKKNYAILTE